MTLFRVRDWSPGDDAPDLWKLLRGAVCKKPNDTKKRIPIADSKSLKLANDTKTRHPLVHLERGVLAFLRGLTDQATAHDVTLFERLGAEMEPMPWYGGEATALPLGVTEGELAIAAARIAGECESAGVELLEMRCVMIPENAFNETVKRTGSKGETTAIAMGRHLRALLARRDFLACDARIVCDQLGGRTQYEGLLSRELDGIAGAVVSPLAESEARSRYSIAERAIIQFMPEAESAHLPVALASMIAKYTRELAMMRFNRYWCGRVPELKPTAGYSTDARRWLNEMRDVLAPEERVAMVRIA
jgi:ribonuclease HII